MRYSHLVAATALGTVALGACGIGSSYSSPSASTTPGAPVAQTAIVKTGDTSLGTVLVDSNGLTLYGLTKDSGGAPTVRRRLREHLATRDRRHASLPAGLDAKVFSVVSRPDDSHQLKAGKWPLYRFAGDAAAGDTNGQGTAGFFVVTPNGTLHKS